MGDLRDTVRLDLADLGLCIRVLLGGRHLQRLLDQLRLVAGIDDGGQVRLVVLQNIAVGADGPHPQQLYFHR